jgi:hypothetical protein
MKSPHIRRPWNPGTGWLGLALALGTLASPMQLQAALLVKEGKARALLVTPDQPSPAARRALVFLQEHLQQISGAKLAVRKESEVVGKPSDEQPWVLVGEGPVAQKLGFTTEKLGPGGVLLQARENMLALMGTDSRTPSDPNGTVYAVTLFLEEKLGVRYLWPGELGKVAPRQATIDVADFEMRLTPRLTQRHIRSMGYHDRLQVGLDRLQFTREEYEKLGAEARKTEAESGDWFQWHRLGGTLNLKGGHAFSHLWGKYGKDHPDWFALQPNGSRDQSASPDRARLCKSNADLIAAIAREKIEELNKNPNLLGVSLGPNDGGRTSFCTCPRCEALDDPRGRKVLLWDFTGKTRRDFEHVALTDRMVYFWNAIAEQVAKVHPKKLLIVDAYSVYAAPPVSRKLHPNLVVRFASLGYHDEAYRTQSLRDWDDWSKAARGIFFRPNLMLLGRRDGLPLLYVHGFAQDFRHLAEHGLLGTDFDSCCHNWATQGLNYYIVARLNWDPEQDVDKLVDDYCRAGFGPSARSVRRYFDRLEAIRNDMATKKQAATTAFSAEALKELRRLLEQARKDAGRDATIVRRLDFLEVGLRWTDIEVQAHAFLLDPEKADKDAVKRVLDERRSLMREIFRKTPLALNVAYISWGEDRLWDRLGYKPTK